MKYIYVIMQMVISGNLNPYQAGGNSHCTESNSVLYNKKKRNYPLRRIGKLKPWHSETSMTSSQKIKELKFEKKIH